MIYAIVGSKIFKDSVFFGFVMKFFPNVTMIVSGDASGTDTLAKEWAGANGIEYKGHPAKWNILVATSDNPVEIRVNKFGEKYNRLAGFNRNTLIVNDAEITLAFWDFKTPGTRDTVEKTIKAGKPLIVANTSSRTMFYYDYEKKTYVSIDFEDLHKKIG